MIDIGSGFTLRCEYDLVTDSWVMAIQESSGKIIAYPIAKPVATQIIERIRRIIDETQDEPRSQDRTS